MVLDLVRSIHPEFVLLDFDQTLCSTKSGLQPIPGKHGLNPQLFEILASHPKVHIITRQNVRHKQFLENFIKLHLECNGFDPSKEFHVHCLGQSKPKLSKADIMDSLMDSNTYAVFVDDGVREVSIFTKTAMAHVL